MTTKSLFVTLLICLVAICHSTAQNYDNALGLRLGWGFGVSFKHFISDEAALEGIARFGGVYMSYTQITGLYQKHKPLDEVLPGLQWYIGGGGFIGLWGGDFTDRSLRIGIAGNIGLDYAFEDIPLNISLDWIPSLALTGFGKGFGAESGGFAVRYIF